MTASLRILRWRTGTIVPLAGLLAALGALSIAPSRLHAEPCKAPEERDIAAANKMESDIFFWLRAFDTLDDVGCFDADGRRKYPEVESCEQAIAACEEASKPFSGYFGPQLGTAKMREDIEQGSWLGETHDIEVPPWPGSFGYSCQPTTLKSFRKRADRARAVMTSINGSVGAWITWHEWARRVTNRCLATKESDRQQEVAETEQRRTLGGTSGTSGMSGTHAERTRRPEGQQQKEISRPEPRQPQAGRQQQGAEERQRQQDAAQQKLRQKQERERKLTEQYRRNEQRKAKLIDQKSREFAESFSKLNKEEKQIMTYIMVAGAIATGAFLVFEGAVYEAGKFEDNPRSYQDNADRKAIGGLLLLAAAGLPVAGIGLGSHLKDYRSPPAGFPPQAKYDRGWLLGDARWLTGFSVGSGISAGRASNPAADPMNEQSFGGDLTQMGFHAVLRASILRWSFQSSLQFGELAGRGYSGIDTGVGMGLQALNGGLLSPYIEFRPSTLGSFSDWEKVTRSEGGDAALTSFLEDEDDGVDVVLGNTFFFEPLGYRYRANGLFGEKYVSRFYVDLSYVVSGRAMHDGKVIISLGLQRALYQPKP